VIADVSRALKYIVTTASGAPPDLQVSYDPPTKQWAALLDRSKPTINFCCYDVREDMTRKRVGRRPVRDERNVIVGYWPPPRWYKVSYIGTAWAGDVEQSQELLSFLLQAFSGMDALPKVSLKGKLAEAKSACQLLVAQPAVDARPTPQSLTALSGEVRPTLDLVITAPVESAPEPAAGIVLEPLILDARGRKGRPAERVQRRRERALGGGIRELVVGPPGAFSEERPRSGLDEDDAGGRHELDPD
jgi:hypothetical protein